MNLVRKLLGLSSSEPEPARAADTSPLPSKVSMSTVQLAAPKQFSKPQSRMRYGVRSHIGGRENNEDSAMALLVSAELTGNPPPVGVFMVADGMGGHQHGERASALSVRVIGQMIVGQIVVPFLAGGEQPDDDAIQEILTETMTVANSAVREEVPGGGNTATVVVVRGETAYIAHVGDSRAYLLDEDEIEQITRDHSMVERLRELGQMDDLPMRNVLYKAIGAGDKVESDSITRRLAPGSMLLICSDGLWDVLGEARIKEILQGADSPQQACDQLVASTNELQGEDNITAVVVQMPN